MGLLSKIFKMDKETEHEVKEVLKFVSAIVLIVAAGKAGVEFGALPIAEDKEVSGCVRCLVGAVTRESSITGC